MLPPIINRRGYQSDDPYDRLTKRKSSIIHLVVTLVVISLFFYLAEQTFSILKFRGVQEKWSFIIILTLFYGLFSKILRKSSSLFFLLILFLPFFCLDLFFEVNANDRTPLWVYKPNSFISSITPLALKFLVWNILLAFCLGPLLLWVGRMVALIFVGFPRKLPANIPTYKQLFRPKWTADPIAKKPERKFSFLLLKWIGLVYLIYLTFLCIGAFSIGPKTSNIWPTGIQTLFKHTFENPIHGLNFMGKMVMMSILGLLAAYNKSLRWFAVLALLVGHVVSTIFIAIFYFSPTVSQTKGMLLSAGIVDAILSLLLLYALIKAKPHRGKIFQRVKGLPTAYSLPYWLITRAFNALTVLFLVCLLYTSPSPRD